MDAIDPGGSALARETLARLRGEISSGRWPVGSRIPTEPELSEWLGVGRSTVREAIRSLTALGMVRPLTARGTFVTSATPSPALLVNAMSAYSAADIVGLRRALDVEAAQAAAAQLSEAGRHEIEAALHDEVREARSANSFAAAPLHCARIHGAIARASGNRLLADLDAGLSAAMEATGTAVEVDSGLDPATRLDHHDRIYTAIRNGDVATAAHAMAVHADAALRALHHEPIVTDLTALLSTGWGKKGRRGIA